jgi:ABC-type uncharacterized transport system permease subunit
VLNFKKIKYYLSFILALLKAKIKGAFVFRFSLFIVIINTLIFTFFFLLSAYLFYKSGLIKIELKRYLLSVILAEQISIFVGLITWNNFLEYQIEYGKFKNYLKFPVNPFLVFLIESLNKYNLVSNVFYFFFVIFILLFFYKVELLNLIKGFLVFFTICFFLYSFYVIIYSLDLIKKGLTSLFMRFNYTMTGTATYYPPSIYQSLGKIVILLISLFVYSTLAYYFIILAFLDGKIEKEVFYLFFIAIVNLIVSYLIWKIGLKKLLRKGEIYFR